MKLAPPSLLILLVLAASTLYSQDLVYPPFVGAVTDTEATVQVRLTAPATVVVHYSTQESFSPLSSSAPVTISAATDLSGKIVLSGLQQKTRYYYRIANESNVPLYASRSFTTFPAEGIDAPVNILFGSCQQLGSTDSGAVFEFATTLEADMFIQLGDWTYPDRRLNTIGYPNNDSSVSRSYELRLDSTYPFSGKVLAEIPVAYVWDDHDWAGNNSDGDIPSDVRQRLMAGYKNHIPHYSLPNQAGIWQSFVVGNVEVFMIDARSQRNPAENAFVNNRFQPPPGHSMLAGYPVEGIDQRRWLLDAIRNSSARWKVLVSPVYFNPASITPIHLALFAGRPDAAIELADKWAGYPADIDSMRALFNEGFGKNFAIITGDAHTNLYDNGEHSLVPEFMVGNLDITNSDLYNQFRALGVDIWTAGQPGLERTIGRIRVETSPVHKLVLESFDEFGRATLSYEMIDESASTDALQEMGEIPDGVRDITVADGGSSLQIQTAGPTGRDGIVTLHTLDGREIFRQALGTVSQPSLRIPLPHHLHSGIYMARMSSSTMVGAFPVVVIR